MIPKREPSNNSFSLRKSVPKHLTTRRKDTTRTESDQETQYVVLDTNGNKTEVFFTYEDIEERYSRPRSSYVSPNFPFNLNYLIGRM